MSKQAKQKCSDTLVFSGYDDISASQWKKIAERLAERLAFVPYGSPADQRRRARRILRMDMKSVRAEAKAAEVKT